MRVSCLVLSMLCAAGGCALNPVTRNAEFSVVSEAHEIEWGHNIDRTIVDMRGVYQDSVLGRYIQEFGLRLAATCERPNLPWTFRVVDDTSINAFAGPGGFVYVTRGMLAYLNSEAQLAAVLGHEIGHIAARHAAGQMTRRQLAGSALVAASLATSWSVGYVSAAGLEVLFLANSRHAEEQADGLGLHYMSSAGYDPMEMVAVLRMLDRVVGGAAPRGWLATHPNPEHRIESVVLERFTLRGYGTRVDRDAYLRHLDGLAFREYGAPPWHRSVLKGNVFVAPDGRYQFTFPDGWKFGSESGLVRGWSPAHDAAIEIAIVDQPRADSAAHVFFTQRPKAHGSLIHARLNGLLVVSASFFLRPPWPKTHGYVSFIEHEGAVYRVLGSASEKQWPIYRGAVQGAMRTFESVPTTDPAAPAAPVGGRVYITTFIPGASTSLAALFKLRSPPIELADLALMNQVPSDSLLPAGQRVKWVEVRSTPH